MYIYVMKWRLLLFLAFALVILSFNGCNPDDIEETAQSVSTQDSINEVLSQLQGTWYLSQYKDGGTWYNCDGLWRWAWIENRTNNLEYADFKFIFTSNEVNIGPAGYQFDFSGNQHTGYLRLQVNGYQDYYAISKEGNYYFLHNNVNNAGWSYCMGGKYVLQIHGDSLMSLYGGGIDVGSSDQAFLFKKNPVNELPENPIGLNGTYVLMSKDEISSGVIVSTINYTNGLSVTFSDEIVSPGIQSYSYVPDAYKGVWYKALVNSGGVGPYLDNIYCEPTGVFYYSTGEIQGINAGQILNVGSKAFEIVENDGISLTIRKGGGCYYTDWHFTKVM
jgi:hypothetical protein